MELAVDEMSPTRPLSPDTGETNPEGQRHQEEEGSNLCVVRPQPVFKEPQGIDDAGTDLSADEPPSSNLQSPRSWKSTDGGEDPSSNQQPPEW